MKHSARILRYASVVGFAAAGLSVLAKPAHAGFTLNSTSGEWSNPNGGAFIEYQNNNSTILWGDPAYGYSSTAGKSGLGFEGVSNLTFEAGQVFNIGTLTHYNKTIWGGTAASAADLKLDLDFGFGSQSFDFTMNIDETANQASYYTGGVCPYFTTPGQGCSDSITWSNNLTSNNFMLGRKEYKLDLVGFSESMDMSTIKQQFISQEGMSSDAHIFAQVSLVNDPGQEVPEPTALLGLGAIGWAIARSRRSNAKDAN